MRVVRVNHVRREPFDDAGETPRRREIYFRSGSERNQLEPFGGAPAQLAVGVRDERRTMAERSKAVDGQQDLVLAAAPRPGGINVEGEHLWRRV